MNATFRASDHFRLLWGWGAAELAGCPVAIWSARLDETGTDGRAKMMFLGGAVALPNQWDALENSWERLLTRTNMDAYHFKEFNDSNNPIFGKWSAFKKGRFVEAQEKAIKKNTLFRVAVGIDPVVHADVKKRMKGITGFTGSSDYSLCLRWLMFAACEELCKIDPDCRLSILVEDGPWAAGAADTYQRVAAMTGPRKPARHAHRLVGFGSAPKGIRRSLEAADYLVGTESARLLAGKRSAKDTPTLSVRLTAPVLEKWYEGMIEEKERRREYAKNKRATSSTAGGSQP